MSYSYQCPKGHTDTRDNNRTVFCSECKESYPKQSLTEPTALSKLRTSTDYVSPKRWSANHDVIHYLTPFEHFSVNPWDQLNQFTQYLQELPESKATFKWSDMGFVNHGGDCSERLRIYCDLVGAYLYQQNNSRPSVWVNPYYMHYDDLDWVPDTPKVEYSLRVALFGKWTVRDISDRFNANPNSIAGPLKRRHLQFGDVQAYGRKRLANTVLAATQWRDYTVSECARRVQVPYTTLRDWIDRYGDFDAEPPSSKPFSNDWG